MALSTFNDRYNDGLMGEDCVRRALELQIIPNAGYGPGPIVTEMEWNATRKAQIFANKVDGDWWFIDVNDGRKKYVDVKNGIWVANESLKHFRTDDSYYFINAFAWSSGNFYFLIRADQMMRDFVFANCDRYDIVRENKTEIGYLLDYNKFPVDKFNSSKENGRLPEIDPKDYKKRCVAWKMEQNDENGIPYKFRLS